MWRFVRLLTMVTLLAFPLESAPPAQSVPADGPAVAGPVQTALIAGSAMDDCQSPAVAWPDSALAQKSCCSGAGGFCGCSGGKVRCCNGDIAASCACRADTSPDAAIGPQQ